MTQPASSPDLSRAGVNPWFITLLMGTACAFLLGGYEFIRSTATTLFKAAIGKEYLPAVMATTPLGIILGLYLYGRLLSAFGPKQALRWTSLASGAAFLAGYGLWQAGFTWIPFPLYVLREVYVVLIIEQYWSFMVSFLTEEHARRMNGPFCGIASVGSVAGGFLLAHTTTLWGVPAMLIAGAASLLPATLLVERAYNLAGEPRPETGPDRDPGPDPKQPVVATAKDHLGLGRFFRNPVLFLLFLLIFVTQAIGTCHEINFQNVLQETIPDMTAQNAYSGRFFGWLNLLAALSQFLLVPLLLSILPLWPIHFLLPLVQLLACAGIAVGAGLTGFGLPYLLFKVLDYSLFRSAKEIFYIPLSFDERYRAKELIDVLGYRLGKGGTALVIMAMQAGGWLISPRPLIAGAVAGLITWLILLVFIRRGLSPSTEKQPQS